MLEKLFILDEIFQDANPHRIDLQDSPRKRGRSYRRFMLGMHASPQFSFPDNLDQSWLIPYAHASGAIGVEVGDLMYAKSGKVAYPGAQLATAGALAADQTAFAQAFLGLSTDKVLSTEVNAARQMNVRTEGTAWFTVPSASYVPGQLLGIYSDGVTISSTNLTDATTNPDGAIAVVIPAPGQPTYYDSAVTRVHAYFVSRRGGQQIPMKLFGVSGGGTETNTNISTVGAGTLTAAGIVGGVITRSGSTADYTDTTATAAQIIAAAPAGVSSWRLTIKNTVAFAQTLAAGTGVTLADQTVVPPLGVATFLVTIDSSSAVTIRGLGIQGMTMLPASKFTTTAAASPLTAAAGSRRLIAGLKAALEAQFDSDAISLFVIERESGGTALVPKTGKTYVLRIHNWSAYKFLRWLYYDTDLLCLGRKRAVAEELFRIYAKKTNKDDRYRLTEEAIALRRQNLSHGRIMQLLNITLTQAKNYTRSVKGIKAADRTYARKTDPVLVAEMRRLRQDGWSPGLIAKHLGVPKPTVEDNVRDITTPVTRTLEGDVEERNRGIERIVAPLKEGKSTSEVAELTGESLDKVKSWKRKACPGRPVTSGKRRTVTPEKRKQMHELAKQDLTNEQISERIGLSAATVKKHLRGVRSE